METKFDINEWGRKEDQLRNKYPEITNADLVWGHISRNDSNQIDK